MGPSSTGHSDLCRESAEGCSSSARRRARVAKLADLFSKSTASVNSSLGCVYRNCPRTRSSAGYGDQPNLVPNLPDIEVVRRACNIERTTCIRSRSTLTNASNEEFHQLKEKI